MEPPEIDVVPPEKLNETPDIRIGPPDKPYETPENYRCKQQKTATQAVFLFAIILQSRISRNFSNRMLSSRFSMGIRAGMEEKRSIGYCIRRCGCYELRRHR